MTLPLAALSQPIVHPFWVGWLDFDGDPVRATTLPGGLTLAAGQTGDADLDGHSWEHVPASIIEVSGVLHQSGGSDAVTVTLSGMPGPDAELFAALADRERWQGRIGRLWHGTHDGNRGNIVIAGYYTGYMVQAALGGDPESGGRVTITLEDYLATLSQPRGRSYQDQAIYDPADKTAARIRAAANGTKGTAL